MGLSQRGRRGRRQEVILSVIYSYPSSYFQPGAMFLRGGGGLLQAREAREEAGEGEGRDEEEGG
jgi:hypothetical protein